MQRRNVIGLCVGAVALGVIVGITTLSVNLRPVEGKVVDKVYEQDGTVAELTILVEPNEFETVRDHAYLLVGCHVSRSSPVHYPTCRTIR